MSKLVSYTAKLYGISFTLMIKSSIISSSCNFCENKLKSKKHCVSSKLIEDTINLKKLLFRFHDTLKLILETQKP